MPFPQPKGWGLRQSEVKLKGQIFNGSTCFKLSRWIFGWNFPQQKTR